MKKLLITAFIALTMFSVNVAARDDALNFDGVTNYVQLSEALTIGDKSNTVELWVKVPEVGSGNLASGERVGIILGNFDDSPNVNWEIHDDGQMRLYWNGGTLNIFGTTDLRDNQWHHIAFVRDTGSDQFILYLDGEIEHTYVGSGSDIALSSMHRIGADNRASGTPYFHGQMDELRIWDVARNQTQIQNYMHSALTGTETNLLHYYDMSEGSGTNLYDNAGNNDGTLMNMDACNWVRYAGGCGTEIDPYQIADSYDLIVLSNRSGDWNKHFIQTADISFHTDNTQVDWDGHGSPGPVEGFFPIGNLSTNFTGSYSGDGLIISNLFLDRSSTDYTGLFGYTDGATISDVRIEDCHITGQNYVGGLVGYNDDSIISHCYSTGDIRGASDIGGLVGRLKSGSILRSFSTADGSGVSNVGGFVGGIISGGGYSAVLQYG